MLNSNSTRKVGLLAAVITLLVVAAGCTDDDDPQVSLTPSGTERASDLVRLTGFGVDDELVVFVAIGGPTTSSDIFGFNFGIQIGTPGVLEFVQGSAEVGEALMEPGCAEPILLVAPQGDGLTVAFSKLGPCVGNQVESEEENLISLRFRMLGETATTIQLGDAISGPPSALDSAAQPIPGITFDTAPATASLF